ncbi:hypothetical protein ABEG17_14645 [Pedococcus sp. KACC 23699]|uniref:Uncharacterized protein n=1 Tax=Pedococcus sp. KACC 23699 TaxID=3149228 RepID=A0AAU7JRC3_9MICO
MFDAGSPEFFILMAMAAAMLLTFVAVAVLVRVAAVAPRGVAPAARFASRAGR